jgi:hypothetical protein
MAGRVMEHCAPLAAHPRRPAILRACREHDGGWIDIDAAPTVNPETHRPFDFITAPASVRQGVWPRAIARLSDDSWAAALVAHHAVTVYDRFRSDPEWSAFFESTAARRDALDVASGLTRADLDADYPFVRLADLISLTFCAQWADEMGIGSWRVCGRDDRVIVTPDAFGGRTVPFTVPCRAVAARDYGSDTDLRDAVSRSPQQELAGVVAAN